RRCNEAAGACHASVAEGAARAPRAAPARGFEGAPGVRDGWRQGEPVLLQRDQLADSATTDAHNAPSDRDRSAAAQRESKLQPTSRFTSPVSVSVSRKTPIPGA